MRVLGLVLIATLVVLPAAVVAKPEATYYESLVVADAETDFGANGALDVVGVLASEHYRYDPENRTGYEALQLRIEVRAPSDIQTLASPSALSGEPFVIEYEIGFKAGGAAKVYRGTLSIECFFTVPNQEGGGLECPPVPEMSPPFRPHPKGLLLVLDRSELGLGPGDAITDLYAASALPDPSGGRTYQDVAPKDNQNVPAGTEPGLETYGGPYVLRDVFPFLTVAGSSPRERHIVAGGQAPFRIDLAVVEGVTLDDIHVLYATPPGWKASGPFGTLLPIGRGGQVFPYEFTVEAPFDIDEATRAQLSVEFILLNAGGRVVVPITAVVAGEKVDLPEYRFEPLLPPAIRAGQPTTIKFAVTEREAPLARYEVHVDFLLDGTLVETVLAEEVADGEYAATYTFPKPGAWTADVYVSELKPSPHAEIPIAVSKSNGAPGFEPLLAGLAALLVGALRRRGAMVL